MIEVKITDTKGNMCKMISFSKVVLQTDSTKRMVFVMEINHMIGGFLQELKDQTKEAKKCQKE